jgi:hypothetical protein
MKTFNSNSWIEDDKSLLGVYYNGEEDSAPRQGEEEFNSDADGMDRLCTTLYIDNSDIVG